MSKEALIGKEEKKEKGEEYKISIRQLPTKKVLVVGGNGIGKSSLITKFIFDWFPEGIKNNQIGTFYRKIFK